MTDVTYMWHLTPMQFGVCCKCSVAIDVKDKPMKIAKRIDGFLATLCPKYQVQGEF